MLLIERLTPPYVSDAARVESCCLSTAWLEEQLRTLPAQAVYLIAREEETVCGIASVYCSPFDAELQNIAVLPAFRRRGISQALLDELFCILREKACEALFLEVAESNLAAQALYSKNGFGIVGRRAGFYRGEDALVMKKEFFCV